MAYCLVVMDIMDRGEGLPTTLMVQKSGEKTHRLDVKNMANTGVNGLPTSTGEFSGFLVAINSSAPSICTRLTHSKTTCRTEQ